MYKCKICGKTSPSPLLPCPSCARSEKALEIVKEIHESLEKIERKFYKMRSFAQTNVA